MKLGSVVLIGALSVGAVCLSAAAARAQFYNLEGRFNCLTRPGAVCFDATSEPVARPAAKPVPVVEPVSTEPLPSPSAPVVVQKVGSKRVVVQPMPLDAKPKDIKEEIAVRIQAGKLNEGDVAMLQSLARSGDGRALELFAWCTLQGIGVSRDPVQAYILYGQADAAKIPNAKANQGWIYKTILSSDERQKVLEVANSHLARG